MAVELHRVQKEIILDSHRFKVCNLGRKTGKTELALEDIMGHAISPPINHRKPKKISFIGDTRKEAKRIAWDRFKIQTKPLWYKKPNESNLEVYIKVQKRKDTDPDYSSVFFDGWENISALVGEEFDHIVLDEVAKFRYFWIGWQNILRPTLTPRKGSAMFISRPDGFNHWYDLCNAEAKNPNFKTFYGTSFDNPFVDPSEIEEARKDLPIETFEQEYLAKFTKKRGLVYNVFDRTKHLFDDNTSLPHMVKKVAGVDFGFKNPATVLTVGMDSDSGFWVLDEWYEKGRTNPEIISACQAGGATDFYPDPAEPDRIKEMKDAGLYCHPVSKDIEKGIDSVQVAFKRGKLHIHRSCLNTISELESYSYPDKKHGQNENETPIKENDHALDALRYLIHNIDPYTPTQELSRGLYSSSYN